MNLFNDNINTACTSFADVKRLKMKTVAQKFTFLDPSVLRKLLSNLEVLSTTLDPPKPIQLIPSMNQILGINEQ
jgi:hypothetical protein